ncbi:hypothetical protein C0989_007973, partial [Termitomyces sp. Mn162]
RNSTTTSTTKNSLQSSKPSISGGPTSRGPRTASKYTLTTTTCNTSRPQNSSATAKPNGPKPSWSTTSPSTTTLGNLVQSPMPSL